MKQELFRMERVTYKEHEVTLLENFNLQIDQGEILGLLPINAHGLPAFLKLLETNLPLYDGYVYYGGELVNSWKENRHSTNRISVIGGQNSLVESLSVIDNIFVLRQSFKQEILRTELLKKQLKPFLDDIHMDIPLELPLEQLPAFSRVILELLRAVVLGHRLIVLNDIGFLISYEELNHLHEILRHYVRRGFSFLYICPHYEELERICSRCALLSNSRILKIVENGMDLSEKLLSIYNTGYRQMVHYHREKRKDQNTLSNVIFQMHDLNGEYTKNFSVQIFEGECLALQILNNDMFVEICHFLTGAQTPVSGEVKLRERKVKKLPSPKVAVVREQATRTMIFPKLSYMENLCISLSARMPHMWLNAKIGRNIRKEYASVLGEEVFDMDVDELSERQKYQLVYTRILLAKPELVFCVQPFKGADLAHRIFIWQMLEMLLNHGIAVVILSLNLSDSLSLADRLLIVGENEKTEIFREEFSSISEIVPWKDT